MRIFLKMYTIYHIHRSHGVKHILDDFLSSYFQMTRLLCDLFQASCSHGCCVCSFHECDSIFPLDCVQLVQYYTCCPLAACLPCPLAHPRHLVSQDWLLPQYPPYPLPDPCSRPSIFTLMAFIVAAMVEIIVAIMASVYTAFATGMTAVWTSVYCGRSGGYVSSSRRT